MTPDFADSDEVLPDRLSDKAAAEMSDCLCTLALACENPLLHSVDASPPPHQL